MPPLGIGYLLAVLKRRFPEHSFDFHMDPDALIDARPDLVCVSSATENFGHAQALARRVKEALGVPVIVGGMHITVLPHTLPECFDVGVIGEGEDVVCELIEAFRTGGFDTRDLARIKGVAYHDEGRVTVENTWRLVDDLDQAPYPDREGLGRRWGIPYSREIHLCASRGCPYKCSFCSSAGIRARRFSPDYIAGEVEHMRHTYDPEQVFFYDDLFIADRKYFHRICQLFRERGLHEGLVFRTYARANLIDEELLDLFEELNFRYIDFGFESNCERTLRYYDKSGVSPKVNQRALDLMRGRSFSVGANLIIGAPDETREEMGETYDFVARNRDGLDRVSMGPLFPMPGTRVWAEAMERGLVSETMDDWMRLSIDPENWDYERYPLLSKTMSARDLYEFYEHFRALCGEINKRGERRKHADDSALREQRVDRLRNELDTLKGSRLIRWAMAARDFKARIVGRDE
jgi:anaerobic magnesium-protoporphyrin IX monomethyl ester cyclase